MSDQFDLLARDLGRIRTGQRMPCMFGEDSHNYRVNSPLSEAEVCEFESAHRVSLPQDYRQFVTRVGNGGAGPYYGLFRLGEMDHGFGHGPWGDFVGILAEPFPHSNAWNDLTGMPQEAPIQSEMERYDEMIEAFDRNYWDTRLINGAFPICHVGCALRHWLVVTGPEAGNVWCDNRAEYGGLHPLQTNGQQRLTFLDWYRAWLDEALTRSGHNLDRVGKS